jgi:transcriptional regulator with XRE-family HTH domain
MSRTARPQAYTALQKKIGERIQWARELVVPNRSEAARILGLDPSTLSKIEDGTRAPSIFNIIELANKLRVTADYLLRGHITSRMDEEMALKLAALHPELILSHGRKEPGTDMAQASDTRPLPTTPVLEGQDS